MSKANFHEFLIPRGRLFKKGLAVFSSAAIALTALCGSLSLAAEDETAPAAQTVEFAEEAVLFESNYDTVTDYSSYRGDYWVGWGRELAGNAFPQNVEGNGYIAYTQNNMHLGVIRLGHSFKNNSLTDYNCIRAEKGKIYTVEFDMKVYASAVAIGRDLLSDGWPLGNDVKIGIAVGNATKGISDVSYANYCKSDYTSYTEEFETIKAKSNPDSKEWEGNDNGWVHRKWSFTVPQDCDLSNNDALQLFIAFGSRCEIHFDNIKVTSAGKYTGTVLAEEDYSKADINAEKKSRVFTAFSSDMYPDIDPADSTNRVMQCIKSTANYSYLYLGADYRNGRDQVEKELITAEAGDKYRIEFKYKLTKGAGTAAPSFFDLGICTVTSNKCETGLDQWGNNKNYGNAVTFVTKDDAAVTDGWQTYKTVYTVPSVTNTSDNEPMDKLALFCKIENNYYNIYFDDVSVIKISSEKAVISSDSVIYDTEFADAFVRSDRSQSDAFGDAYPVVDPLDSNDNAVLYNGSWYNNGTIFIGSKMTNAQEAQQSAISAKAGGVYNVRFDYYVTGTLQENTPLKIGVCARSASGNAGDNRYKYSFKQELTAVNGGTAFDMTDYKTVSARVEIPEGTDFSVYGDKLALYMTGQGVNVYIDNLTVTELAPVSVRFVVNGKSEYKVFGGNNISYSAAEGKSMLWYTDSAKTKTFGFDFYDNGGKLDNFTVYGEEVKSDIPLIKGDVNCDGIFSSDDMVFIRKALLGVETAASDYHADANSDSAIDICDLVKIKKSMSLLPEDYKINGNAISNYTIVYAEKLSDDVAENTNILAYVNGLAELAKITANSDSTAVADYEIIIGNANRDGVKTDLSANAYIIKAEGNKLYVNGGSANALIAAIKTLEGHIGTGKEISDTYFVDFEYSGGDFSATLALAFSEDFSYDFTGAINNNASPYKSDWTQTYFTDLDNTTTSVKNGSLILKGESYTDENGETAYRGGEVNTKEYYSYGYYEIKAKVNSSTGICPAFWLCGSRDSASKIEYEIDVFECFGKTPDIIKGTLLAHNYPNGSTDGKESSEHNFIYNRLSGDLAPINNYTDNFNNTFFKGDWGNDFHTYGLDLKPDSITWYIDGKAVLTAKPSEVCGGKYIFNEPMRVRLTCYAGRDVNSPMTGLPDETTDWENGNSLVVDYLKIYQYKY